MGFLTTALLALLLCLAACAEDPGPANVAEPARFWTGPMRGAVPASLAGGDVVDSAALATLIAQRSPVLVDVGPLPHKPDMIASAAWMPPPHRTIPHAVWLPGVGAGNLSPQADLWYRARLKELTHGDLTRPIVVFCHPNCWASWNAAKRAIGYGYTSVHWYARGVEGWQDAGQPTAVAMPQRPPS